MKKNDVIAFFASLFLTVGFLDIFKLGFISGFIVGSILWSVLHFNIKKLLKNWK
jgi:hypothetical protein